jgi:DNA-binding NarL/FixJ family response regulator
MTHQLATLRAQLDPATFTALWTAGQALPLAEALGEAAAIAEAAQSRQPAYVVPAKPAYPADLTARAVEVLRLVAQGLTNPQIAARLCISPRTVHAHLRAIYGKLEVTTRSAATRFAVEHGLG